MWEYESVSSFSPQQTIETYIKFLDFFLQKYNNNNPTAVVNIIDNATPVLQSTVSIETPAPQQAVTTITPPRSRRRLNFNIDNILLAPPYYII